MELIGDLNIIYSCYYVYIVIYGIIILSIEVSSFYAGLSLLIVPIILFVVITRLALPKPSDCDVKDILGLDIWKKHQEKELNELNNIVNSDDSKNDLVFRTIAHRAAGLDAPENSISALKLCKERGCTFIEIDLSLTKDGVPIVFHDATLQRMVGIPGNVSDYLWDDLKNFDLKFQPNAKEKTPFAGEKIALFDEFISLCVELGMRVFIDIKDRKEEVVQIILQTYHKYPSLYKRSLVTSFNPFILYKIRSANPNIICSMAWRPEYFSRKKYDPVNMGEKRHYTIWMHLGAVVMDISTTWFYNNFTYYMIGLSAVLLHKDAVSPGIIAMWERRNVRVIAWTVNSRLEKDYFSNVLNIPYMTDTLEYSHLSFSIDK